MKKHFLLLSVLLFFVTGGFSQWASGGTQVSFSAENHHRPFVSALPGGGYYATWVSTDTTADQFSAIRLNAFNANGGLLTGWTNGGKVISRPGDFYAPQLITSEDSGVIVAWYGYADSSSYTEIYVQKYSAAGVALWNSGVPVQVTQDTDYVYEYPIIITDKSNGVFIAYERFDSVIDPSSDNIFLQHIDSTGNVAAGWSAASAPVAVTPNVRQYYPQLALTPDLSSVYVVYGEGLVGSTSLMLNKFNALNGGLATGWPAGALTISPGPDVYPDINHDLKLYTDNANNAVVFWIESRLTANGEIYMQQVDPTGNVLLGFEGNYVAGDVASGNGVDYLEVTQDADRNFLVAFNNLVNFNDVSAMRIQPDGTILWSDTLVTEGGYSAYPYPVSDGKRGMYIFYENTNTPQTLYAIGLDSLGNQYAQWLLPGSSFGDIWTYDGFEPNYDFNAASTDSSKAIVAWTRVLPSGLFGIFTCNLLPDGSVCTEQPFVITASSGPPVCAGANDTLHASATGGNGPYHYSWQATGDALSCNNCPDPHFTATQNSIFIVTITDADLYEMTDTIYYTISGGNNLHLISSGADTFCTGGSVVLNTAPAGTGAGYEWFLNGRNEMADSGLNSITASLSGTYQVIANNNGSCADTTNVVTVLINPLPTVYFATGAGDTLCSNSNAITLTGGNPEGGIYSGAGVSDDSIFNPTGLTGGTYDVTYTYTGPNGCSNKAYEPILVEACTGINTVPTENEVMLYPNPAGENITAESEQFYGVKVYPEIYDVSGQLILLPFTIKQNKIIINTTGLAVGVYLVRFNINSTVVSKRFIKAE